MCAKRISRYIERKYVGGLGGRNVRVYNGGEVFSRYKKRAWRRK